MPWPEFFRTVHERAMDMDRKGRAGSTCTPRSRAYPTVRVEYSLNREVLDVAGRALVFTDGVILCWVDY